MNKELVISRLKTFFDKDFNTIFAFMFGSSASGKQKKTSDWDIAIYFVNPPEGIELLYFINNLSETIGLEFDLVVLNNASAFLRHQVMKYRIPVIIKDKVAYREFREKTLTDYDEYKFISNMNVYD